MLFKEAYNITSESPKTGNNKKDQARLEDKKGVAGGCGEEPGRNGRRGGAREGCLSQCFSWFRV